MSKQRLLEGDVIDMPSADDGDARIRKLESDLRTARLETQQARNELETAQESLRVLRQTLMPLHRALKAVFGEIEIAVGEDAPPAQASVAPSNSTAVNPVWEEWKQRLGGAPAKIITALQKHKDADTTQLCILIGTSRRQTVHDAISTLNKAGLISKNDGRFSLREL